MVSLPVHADKSHPPAQGCGRNCGAGLEKVYPSTAVRWGAMNYIGEFSYRGGTVFRCGAKVVIQTDRGIELGQQVSLSCTGCNKSISREQIQSYVASSGEEFYALRAGRILREASAEDVAEHERLNAHMREDVDRCALLGAQLSLDMKVIASEHMLGGERIVFYFRADERVDFRELVRELGRHYQTRIEMKQVRPREEARLVADYEICGRECCCKSFLKKTHNIKIGMAKLQKSTLDPSKLSGRCGRLRCCLRYEHEGYQELDKKLPRVGALLETDHGVAQVIDRQILTQLLMVRLEDGRTLALALEQVRSVVSAKAPMRAAPERPQRPGAAPRVRRPLAEEPLAPQADAPEAEAAQEPSAPAKRRSRRRRKRRGGGVEGADGAAGGAAEQSAAPQAADDVDSQPDADEPGPAADADQPAPAASRKRRRRRRKGGRPPGTEGGSPPPSGESPNH